jgi:hypothetical protein
LFAVGFELFLVAPEGLEPVSSEVLDDSSGLGDGDLLLGVGAEEFGSLGLVSEVHGDGTGLEDGLAFVLKVRQVGQWVSLEEGSLVSSPSLWAGVLFVLELDLEVLEQEFH